MSFTKEGACEKVTLDVVSQVTLPAIPLTKRNCAADVTRFNEASSQGSRSAHVFVHERPSGLKNQPKERVEVLILTVVVGTTLGVVPIEAVVDTAVVAATDVATVIVLDGVKLQPVRLQQHKRWPEK